MKNNKQKCIIFCRVSSKEQEETGYSLPAQEKYLKDYCYKNELTIDKVFKISESASGEKQRNKFAEMLKYVKDKKLKIIVCEKADRLTRNFKDMVAVDGWLRQDGERKVHLVKDSLIMHKDSRSQEKLNWGIRILFAKNYIDNLSEEVKKGQKAKIEAGWLPTKPPLGYKTVGEKGHKIHVVDDEVAPYIKTMFKLYSTGNYSLKKLCEIMYDKGLRSKTGKPVGKSSMHRFLLDPFYCGKMKWSDKIYQGKHKAIISEELFDKVQEKITRPINAPRYKKHLPIFKGKIKCGECGGVITWAKQKGHWYGYCNRYKPCSQKKYIRQEDLEEMIFPLFDKVSPKNEKVLNWLEKNLKDSFTDQKEYKETQMKTYNNELKKIEQRLEAIYEDKIDKNITLEFYNKKFKQYSEAEKSIKKNIEKLNDNTIDFCKQGVAIHDLAFNAKKDYLNPKTSTEKKREILSEIFLNFQLKDLKLDTNYTPAFEFLLKWMPRLNSTFELHKNRLDKGKTGLSQPVRSVLLAWRDSFRTWVANNK